MLCTTDFLKFMTRVTEANRINVNHFSSSEFVTSSTSGKGNRSKICEGISKEPCVHEVATKVSINEIPSRTEAVIQTNASNVFVPNRSSARYSAKTARVSERNDRR